MTDSVWRREEIDSPCKKICVILPQSGYCAGCFRTRDEIARWSVMSAAERRAVIDELKAREKIVPRRKGGRKSRLNRDIPPKIEN